MRLILLYFVLFKSAFSNEESAEKYIDLLPEEEKRQFLEKIARRILEDYHNTKVPNASNVNMSEGDLATHSAYVQGLLQEEAQLLKNERHNESHRREANDDKIKDSKNERKVSAESENSFTDLTLRNGKREKRRNVSQGPSADESVIIPVLPLYDDKPVDLISVNNKSTNTPEGKVEDYIGLNYLNKNSTINNEQLNSTANASRKLFVYDDISEDNYEKNDDKIDEQKKQNYETIIEDNRQDDDGQIKSTVIDNFEPSTNENTEDSSKEETVEVTTDATNLATIVRSKGKNVRNGNSQDNADFDVKSSSVSNSEEVKTTPGFTSISDNTSIIKNETDLYIPNNKSTEGLKLIDIDSANNTQQLTSKSVAKILTTRSVKSDKTETSTVTTVSLNTTSVATRRTYESTIDSIVNTTKLDTIESKETINTDLDVQVNLTHTTEPSTLITTKQLNKGIKRLNSNDLNVFESAQIRTQNKVKPDDKDDRRNKFPAKESDPVYHVYEISAEKPPFRVLNAEEPHYAPVHNYDPAFAYYNPYNRFGPNGDELSYKDSVKDKSTDKRRNRFRNPYSVFNDQYKLSMLNILKHQNNYNLLNSQHIVTNAQNVNPNDYIDMDYFFGRNEDPNLRRGKKKPKKRVFPDSNESEHPYQTIQKSLQSHLRAVRKLLYAHKHFGYIPPRPKISHEDETLRSKDFPADLFDHADKYKNDITLDYYFGRQNSQEVGADRLFQIKLSELKDVLTATPNPINGADGNLEVESERKSNDVQPLINVLKDMIQLDNEALTRYDWLMTTVDIQAALSKLKLLTNRLKNTSRMHPNDLELFKYVVYLYKSTKGVNDTTLSMGLLKDTINKLRKRIKKKSLMPKIKKKPKKFASAIQMWKDFRTFLRTLVQYDKVELLRQFEGFLAEIQFNLNDFHGAIRNIATVTKYQNQTWYADLKNIYFKKADKRMLLEVILHLSLSRLLGLIEESSTNGLEDSFTDYVKHNKKEVDSAKEEFKMVLQLLKEFKRLN